MLDIITASDVERYAQKDIDFVHEMEERLGRYGDKTSISPRQLFWLRDIKDKSL